MGTCIVQGLLRKVFRGAWQQEYLATPRSTRPHRRRSQPCFAAPRRAAGACCDRFKGFSSSLIPQWLTAIPSDEAHVLAPEAMQIAPRRRLRLALPLTSNTCGDNMPGCGRPLDPLGDHAIACFCTGLLARRAKIVEHAWVRVAREAIGPEGRSAAVAHAHDCSGRRVR